MQVPETLPAEVLAKMHAAPKNAHPVITAAQLPEFDGFIFGTPTRFGMMAAQVGGWGGGAVQSLCHHAGVVGAGPWLPVPGSLCRALCCCAH